MPGAPAIPTQTPGLIVKAGDIGNFSEICKALLAKCGYDQEDFGSHKYVQDEISSAKEKVRTWDEAAAKAAAEKKPPPPNPPSERERFLAHCTSGHLSQDGLYHRPPEAGGAQNDPCLNHTPGGPRGGDARGYHRDMAPAMPLLTGEQGSSQPLPGSPFGAVDQAEKAQAQAAIDQAKEEQKTKPPTTPAESTAKISQDQLSKNAKDNAALALHEGKDPASLPPQHQQAVAAKQGAPVPPPPGATGDAKSGPGDATKEKPKQEFTGDTAADCVESFRQAMMKHMREEAIRKHGSADAHRDTQKRAQERVDEAKANLKAAEQKQKDSGATERQNERRIRDLENKPNPTQKQKDELAERKNEREGMREDQRNVDRAKADVKDAEVQLQGGECTRQQVESMQREGNLNPKAQGVVPGWPESAQSGK